MKWSVSLNHVLKSNKKMQEERNKKEHNLLNHNSNFVGLLLLCGNVLSEFLTFVAPLYWESGSAESVAGV